MILEHQIEQVARKIAQSKGHHPDQLILRLPPSFSVNDLDFIYYTDKPMQLWAAYYNEAKACLEAMAQEDVPEAAE